MDKFQLKFQFNESITKVGSQLDHIRANVPRNECKSVVTDAYRSNFRKPVYIAFKLPNTLPMYNKKTIDVSIYLKCSICESMHVNVAFST
jgi:hypothetical protein